MFYQLWQETANVMEKTVTDSSIARIFSLLIDYSLDEIQEALDKHMKDPVSGKFMPKPANVIERIQSERRKLTYYKRLEDKHQVRNYTAHNECMAHVKKLFPNFRSYEDREEEKLRRSALRDSESSVK